MRTSRQLVTHAPDESDIGRPYTGSLREQRVDIPTVKFMTSEGEVTLELASMEKAFTVGQRLKILYSTKDPNSAVLDSFSGLFGKCLLVLCLALIPLGIGHVLLNMRIADNKHAHSDAQPSK